jgi:uncharacterized membrane protein YccC
MAAPAKPPLVGINQHPRAASSIRAAKSYGAMGCFLLAAYLSYSQGLALADVGLRALVAGCIGYLAAGFAAVIIWRHVLDAQARNAVERAHARRLEAAQKRAETDAS